MTTENPIAEQAKRRGRGRPPVGEGHTESPAKRPEPVQQRSHVESASWDDVKKNPEQFEHWVAKFASARYVIRGSTRIEGRRVGETIVLPPLTAEFNKGHFFMSMKDPDYEEITEKLRANPDTKNGWLVCFTELEAEKKRTMNPNDLGKSEKVLLQNAGILNDEHATKIKAMLKIKDDAEVARLSGENKDLKARLEALEKKLAQ